MELSCKSWYLPPSLSIFTFCAGELIEAEFWYSISAKFLYRCNSAWFIFVAFIAFGMFVVTQPVANQPAQPYSNALLMPIAIKHYPTCGPSSTSPLQPVQRLVHAISNWELECSPLDKNGMNSIHYFKHTYSIIILIFVLFAVHIIYQSPHIDCPFLFIFLHG